MAGVTLLRHLRRTPVAAFVAFMFLGQFATYISSFPVVLWLQEQKGFTLEEVGTLTVIGAFGNMLGCYVGGVGFDTVPSKRLALAAATVLSTFPYLLFLAAPAGVATLVPLGNSTDACQGAEAAGSGSGGTTTSYALTLGEKTAIIFIWVLCSIGYGALYTVQTGQMRLLADNSVAAMYSGLCMGMLAVAAAVGAAAAAAPPLRQVYTGMDIRTEDYRCGLPSCGTLASRTATGNPTCFCSGCSSIVYCCPDHLEEHWPAHSEACFQAICARVCSGDVHKDDTGGLLVVERRLRKLTRVHGALDERTLDCMQTLGDFYRELGRLSEAELLLRECLAGTRSALCARGRVDRAGGADGAGAPKRH
jgi:hypothetical protein